MPVDIEERSESQARLAPGHLAGLPLDAPQLGSAGIPPARSIQVSLVVDRRVPVRLHRLVTARRVAPDHFVSARRDAQQRASRAVRLGDEHLVGDDDGRGGVDTVAEPGAPRVMKLDFASKRVEPDQPAAGKHEAPAPAADRRQSRRGVAGQLVAERVLHFARSLVKGHDPRAVAHRAIQVEASQVLAFGRASANHHDQ